MDEREQRIRATLTEKLARAIKRQGYNERQIIQVLRVTPDKANALLSGQLDNFTSAEIRRMIETLT
jgi:predicted XRE-type DNA-binding protein